jgi:hypothetical protein
MKLRACSHRDQRQSGHALLLAALMGIMGFGLWATAYRATQDATGMAASEEGRTLRLEVLTEAMARAGHLLESGLPPYSSYSCVSRHRTDAGEWQAVVLQFERQGRSERWAVETRLANDAELRKLPAAPSLFRSEKQGERGNSGRSRSSGPGRITPAGSRRR